MLFLRRPDASPRVGTVFAVGCPFAGLIKTMAMIQHGTVLAALFPNDPIRTLLRTMPGAYELFPSRATIGLISRPREASAALPRSQLVSSGPVTTRPCSKAPGRRPVPLPLQLPVLLRMIEGYGRETATMASATSKGDLRIEWTIQMARGPISGRRVVISGRLPAAAEARGAVGHADVQLGVEVRAGSHRRLTPDIDNQARDHRLRPDFQPGSAADAVAGGQFGAVGVARRGAGSGADADGAESGHRPRRNPLCGCCPGRSRPAVFALGSLSTS